MLCSCSSAVGMEDLVRALALGARDVRTRAVVLERHYQGADHPVGDRVQFESVGAGGRQLGAGLVDLHVQVTVTRFH